MHFVFPSSDTFLGESSSSCWEQLQRARGDLIEEQFKTLQSIRNGSTTPEPGDESRYMELLSRVMRGVASTTSHDLPMFGSVNAHLDRVYKAVVLDAFEEHRTLSLVCQQLAYLKQNHQSSHSRYVAASARLECPSRIDSDAPIRYTVKEILSERDRVYVLRRQELVRSALACLPSLMVRYLIRLLCDASLAQLCSRKGVEVHTVADLFLSGIADEDVMNEDQSRAPVPPTSAPPAQRGSALAQRLCRPPPHVYTPASRTHFDVVNVLGGIRSVEHLKSLVRQYGEWVRWEYFCGRLPEKDLQ
jgi:hypothetical protein